MKEYAECDIIYLKSCLHVSRNYDCSHELLRPLQHSSGPSKTMAFGPIWCSTQRLTPSPTGHFIDVSGDAKSLEAQNMFLSRGARMDWSYWYHCTNQTHGTRLIPNSPFFTERIIRVCGLLYLSVCFDIRYFAWMSTVADRRASTIIIIWQEKNGA